MTANIPSSIVLLVRRDVVSEYSFALEFSGQMCVRVTIGEHFAFMYLEFLVGFLLHISTTLLINATPYMHTCE